jgi:hypothetical protein
MAILNATHAAAAVKQIDFITVSGSWAGADTATITINGKGLVVTIGTATTTANVAQAICDAINSPGRLDSEGTTDATSNFGGLEFGEFAELTASIDKDALSVVVVTANKAGVPFTLTAADTSAGAATRSSSQVATGPWHWDNGKNWSSGNVPANDDVLELKDQSGPNVGFKYGLPNNSLEVTLHIYMSYTGQLGLPPINNDNASKPYPEYRQQYIRLDDAGSGTNIAHRFGLGKDGTGSPLINLNHKTLKCSPVVYNTGSPQIQGRKALNICCTAVTSTINILGGSVDYSSQDGGTSAFAAFYQTGGDSRGINAIYTTSAIVTMAGGTAIIGGTGAIATILIQAGTLRLENQTGTITTFSVTGGTVDYASTGTITSLNMIAGVFDARSGAGQFVVTDANLYVGASFLDPYRRMAQGNPMHWFTEPSPAVQFGASISQAITVSTS